MKRILFLLLPVFIMMSCAKNMEKQVVYEVSGAISAYKLSYLDKTDNLVSININPESIQDVWLYQFVAEEGDIVYVSGRYKDENSALHISIKIDGKIYKEGFSVGDTVKYLTVSGVIPYD